MAEITHRIVETNGIRMHIAEAGTGPLVLMCHGFPESWYSWRHQLHALAEAGYHAVAPDMRGYGQTDAPAPVEAYTQLHHVGDMVGLLDALGEETAVVAGHDWGAPVAWNSALLRPDRFRAVIGLSVPYSPRVTGPRPTEGMRMMAGENTFYIVHFQEPGVAEAELEANPRDTLRRTLFTLSGDSPREGRWGGIMPRNAPFLSRTIDPPALPAWLTEEDLDYYTAEFTRTGFRGGLNWYRNVDRTWELMAAWTGAPITVPSLFVAGELDGVLSFSRLPLAERLRGLADLRGTVLLPGAGHWTQQERPAEVNRAMIDFLKALDA